MSAGWRARGALEQLNDALEDEVARRSSEILRANAEIQRFAYIVSHDLRAPLVNVMGFASELESVRATLARFVASVRETAPAALDPDAVAAVEEDLPEAIGFIRSSTQRMDRLIGASLRLSREGRRELTPQPVPLRPLFETIAGSLQHQLAAANAEIALAEDLPEIVTDRLAVEQILSNLFDNAVKYLDPARAGRIAVTATHGAGAVTIAVADNGRGIEPKDRERVFELFRRAGPQDRPGEGLGLAFVLAAVHRLGGSLTLDSTPGVGSTFRVTLPRRLRIRAVHATEAA